MTKFAYLIIDDGPSASFLEKLVFLNEHDIKAIWFCRGDFMELRTAVVIKALQTGHIIANQSYSHPRFSDLTEEECVAEILRTHTILSDIYKQAGVVWKHRYFRFPYADDASSTDLVDRILGNAPPTTPDRAAAIQEYLGKLDYEQAVLEGIQYQFYLNYSKNHIDILGTYNAQDWKLAAATEDNKEKVMSEILARIDKNEPESFATLNETDSSAVLVLHDHTAHPENLVLFKQLILKVLKKGYIFGLPK